MSEPKADCIVMREEGGKLSTFGPNAEPLPYDVAGEQAKQLRTKFPHQQFVVVQVVARVEQRQFVHLKESRETQLRAVR